MCRKYTLFFFFFHLTNLDSGCSSDCLWQGKHKVPIPSSRALFNTIRTTSVRSWRPAGSEPAEDGIAVTGGSVRAFHWNASVGAASPGGRGFSVKGPADAWNYCCTSGSQNPGGASKINGATMSTAITGWGYREPIKPRTCKWPRTLVAGSRKPLKYVAILKSSTTLTSVHFCPRVARGNPFQWNATFIEVLCTPDLDPRGCDSGSAEKC